MQIAASIPNFLCQEQVSLGEGYLKKPFTVHNGYLDLPTGPGLGIELDENAMADKLEPRLEEPGSLRRRRWLCNGLVTEEGPHWVEALQFRADMNRSPERERA